MKRLMVAVGVFAGATSMAAQPFDMTQGGGQAPAAQAQQPPDHVRTLVSRLDLEKYKATIKGLTQFGDRREGTERNRKAVDWIEAQLKSYGCETGRITYDPANPRGFTEAELEAQRQARAAARGGGAGRGQGASAGRGN